MKEHAPGTCSRPTSTLRSRPIRPTLEVNVRIPRHIIHNRPKLDHRRLTLVRPNNRFRVWKKRSKASTGARNPPLIATGGHHGRFLVSQRYRFGRDRRRICYLDVGLGPTGRLRTFRCAHNSRYFSKIVPDPVSSACGWVHGDRDPFMLPCVCKQIVVWSCAANVSWIPNMGPGSNNL
jgi:hypothetical protein